MITILDDAGALNENGNGYSGLDRFEARRRIVADLTARGDLVEAKSHEMVIGRCQRSNDVIEPRLKTQWFVRTAPLAEHALEATRSGRTRIVPDRFVKTWEHWLTSIHPVDIPAQRIDFSVVAQVPERMRKLPRWKSVRRKALVYQTQRTGRVRIEKLVVEFTNLMG